MIAINMCSNFVVNGVVSPTGMDLAKNTATKSNLKSLRRKLLLTLYHRHGLYPRILQLKVIWKSLRRKLLLALYHGHGHWPRILQLKVQNY